MFEVTNTDGNPIGDEGMLALLPLCKEMVRLDVGRCQLTPKSLLPLVKIAKKLKGLLICDNRISRKVAKGMSNHLTKLDELEITRTGATPVMLLIIL